MTKKKRFGVSASLSRGLSETINVVENNNGKYRNAVVSLTRIELDPDNPRKLAITLSDIQQGLNKNDPLYSKKRVEFDGLLELSETIKRSGLINPVIIYKLGEQYRVVAGERRTLASMLAGKTEIEARVFNERPNQFDLKFLQWVENTVREDLSLYERVENLREILKAQVSDGDECSVSARELCQLTGLSETQSKYYLYLLNAPRDVYDCVAEGKLNSLDKAVTIANIKNEELRQELLSAAVNGVSLSALRKLIKEHEQVSKKNKSIVGQGANKRPGRVRTRINLGYTKKTVVAELLVKKVLEDELFADLSQRFVDVDWGNLDVATSAFKEFVELLENKLQD